MKTFTFLLIMIACLATHSMTYAQTEGGEQAGKQQPMPGPNELVLPADGVNVPGPFKPNIDLPAARPNHPPIEEIPWMPMPAPAEKEFNPNAPWTTTCHDAETGETYELPNELNLQNLGFMQSPEGDYFGAYNAVEREPDAGPEGFSNLTLASGLDTWPRSGNVKLVMRFEDTGGGDRWYVASGSMQDSGVVLTAAHCVYSRNPDISDWAEEIYIYPAWDGIGTGAGGPSSDEVIQHFGWARGTFFMAGTDYVANGNWDRDVGVIRISRGSSRNVGMLTGWYAWAWGGGCNTTTTYHNFSYPSEDCHNGRDMYYWYGTWDSCPGNQFELTTGGGCYDTLWGGMSGSGAYYISSDNRYVHAVASTSNRDDVGRYCKLWEGFVTGMLDFEQVTRGDVFDLEALRCRALGNTTVQAGSAMDDSLHVYVANATNNNPPNDSYTLRVYLSTNNNISAADTLLATWTYTTDFNAMSGSTFGIPAPTIPTSTPAGSYWIGVILDDGTDTVLSNNDTDTWDAQQITVIPAPPVNDNWENTVSVGSLPATVFGTNFAATEQPDEQHLGPAAATVWWFVQAPANGTMTIDTFGSDFDTMLHIYSGYQNGFPNLVLEVFNDDAGGGLQSEVTFPVVADEFYEIRVAGYNGAEGNIVLNVAQVPIGPTVVVPHSFVVTRGTYVSGGIFELTESDNADMAIQRNNADTQSRTEFEVFGTSPTNSPGRLEVTLEGAVFARSTVVQTIDLWDYRAGGWVLVDARNATNIVDSTAVVTVTSTDLSRFVDPTTLGVRARIHFESLRARQRFASYTDQFFWTFQ